MSISLGDIAALGQARNYPSKASDFGRTLQVFADAIENGTATFTNKTLTSPTLTAPVLGVATATSIEVAQSGIIMAGGDANALVLKVNETLTADRILNLVVNDTARSIDLSGDLTLGGAFSTVGAYSLAITQTANSAVTMPTSAKLKGFAKGTIGYAALNAAGAGVAVTAGETIPVGAYVTRAYFDVTEAFVGNVDSTATLGIGIQDQAVDIQAYAAVSGAPFDATGLEEGSVGVDGAVANYIAIATTAKQPSATIGALNNDASFTSGSVDVYVEYVY